jgi:Na+-transporting NADH:ubiquinone oxidoreductase subunit NqrC
LAEYKEVAEAAERNEQRGGSRWTPIAAAVIAVLAALVTLLVHQRSNQALVAKNNAILAFTHASDSYGYYQAKSIKEDVYSVALLTSSRPNAVLRKVVDHENTTKAAVLNKAQAFEEQAEADDSRSERFVHSYEILEIAATFLECSIVILSISTLVGTIVLPVIATISTLVGLGFAIAGLPV